MSSLWYRETGTGQPPLLFLHGWCCDHTYFAPQLEHFARAHRVVAPDLRGHGRSEKPTQPYTVRGFAEDALQLAEELDLAGAVLVGHSLGGIVALEAASLRPDLVRAAVLVDPAPIARPPGLDELASQLVVALYGPEYAAAARQHVEDVLFAPHDDPELRARVADAMCATPQHVLASTMEQIFAWDGEDALARCRVPLLVVSTATSFNDLARCLELCPALATEVVEVGHFAQLLAPERVNAAIARFLAETAHAYDHTVH